MSRRASALLASTLPILLAPAPVARAQVGASLNRAGSGARAAGMGDAFVAVSDDGTAASWNPAGLAQLRQPELSLVYVTNERGLRLTGLRSRDESRTYSARTFQYTTSSIEFASAAVPFSIARRPVTVQLGWHRPYQLSGRWAGDVGRYRAGAPEAPEATISVNNQLLGDIDVVSLGVAVKLTSHLALGSSLDIWRGGWHERSSLVEEPGPQGSSAFFSGRSDHRLRGRTIGTGLLMTFPAWNVGLVHHAGFWSDYRVESAFHSTEALPGGARAPGARFRVPRSLAAGVARRLPGRFTVAASITHDDWTDALVENVPGVAGRRNFFDGLPPWLSTARSTLSTSFGVEHLLVRGGAVVPLRLGFGWDPQGAVDPATHDPVDYRILSGGLGYNTNRLKFDAAVQYRWATYRASDVLSVAGALASPQGRDAVGRATGDEWRIKVSAIYRIGDTEKVRALLRRILG